MRDFQAPPKHATYKDSTQFNAEFNALYPLIRPTPSVRERTVKMFQQMSGIFEARGMDSAKAYAIAMKAIDPTMDKKILFNAYRAEFTAKELKPIIAFFKTPAGRHYLKVEDRLVKARNGAIEEYIARTIYGALLPMMKSARPPARMPPPVPHVAPPPSNKETPDNLMH